MIYVLVKFETPLSFELLILLFYQRHFQLGLVSKFYNYVSLIKLILMSEN